MKSQNCFIQFDTIQTNQHYKDLEHVFDVVKWEYHAHRPGPSYYGTYRPTDMYVEHRNIEVQLKTPNTAIFDSMFSTKVFDEVKITRFYQDEPFLTVLLKQVILDRMEINEHEDNQDTYPQTSIFLGYKYIQIKSFMNPHGETPLGNDIASCKLERGYQTQSNSIYVPPPESSEPTPQEMIMPPSKS